MNVEHLMILNDITIKGFLSDIDKIMADNEIHIIVNIYNSLFHEEERKNTINIQENYYNSNRFYNFTNNYEWEKKEDNADKLEREGMTKLVLKKQALLESLGQPGISDEQIGNIYSDLFDVCNDLDEDDEAFKYCMQAANYENPEGLYWLGKYYYEGLGIPENKEKGLEYIKRAAEKGSGYAFVALSDHYYKVQPEYDKAFEYCFRAYLKDIPEAYYGLGILYKKGIGVPMNTAKAVELFQEGAKKHNELRCCYQLALYYKNAQDERLFFRYIKKAYNVCDKTSTLFKVIAYEYGNILLNLRQSNRINYYDSTTTNVTSTTNVARAITLLRESAEADYWQAEFALAMLYFDGSSIPRNIEMSRRYLLRVKFNKDTPEYLASVIDNKLRDIDDETKEVEEPNMQTAITVVPSEQNTKSTCTLEEITNTTETSQFTDSNQLRTYVMTLIKTATDLDTLCKLIDDKDVLEASKTYPYIQEIIRRKMETFIES